MKPKAINPIRPSLVLKAASLTALLSAASLSSTRAELIGFYTFDSSGAASLIDESGNFETLRVPAAAAQVPTHDPSTGFEMGSYLFGGPATPTPINASRLISPVNISAPDRPLLTMGAWARTLTLANGRPKIIGSDNGGFDRSLGIDNRTLTNTGGNISLLRYTAFAGFVNADLSTAGGNAAFHWPLLLDDPNAPGTPLTKPQNTTDWTFIAATYDQTTGDVRCYVDLDANSTVDDPVLLSITAYNGPAFTTTAIGGLRQDLTNEPWKGYIDNVFFFDRVLTAAEIKTLRDGKKAAVLAMDPVVGAPNLVLLSPQPFETVIGTAPVTRSITLKNQSNTVLNITSATILPDDNGALFEIIAASVPTTVAPNATANIQVRFSPDNPVGGSYKGKLQIVSDDVDRATAVVSLDSLVIAEPAIAITQSSTPLFGNKVAAGPSPEPITGTITLRNAGLTSQVKVTSLVISGANATAYSVSPSSTVAAPLVIPANGSLDLTVTLTAPASGGAFAASLEITSDDIDSPITNIVLDATTAPDPGFTITGSRSGFGLVTLLPATNTYVFKNVGRLVDLTITNPRITGPDAAKYTLTTDSLLVTPTQETTFTVSLNSAVSGVPTVANLEFTTNAPASPTVSIPLNGAFLSGNTYTLMGPAVNDGSFETSFGFIRGTGQLIFNSENSNLDGTAGGPVRSNGSWSYTVQNSTGGDIAGTAGGLGFVEFGTNNGPTAAAGNLWSEGSANPDTGRGVSAFVDPADRLVTFTSTPTQMPNGLRAGDAIGWTFDLNGINATSNGVAGLTIKFGDGAPIPLAVDLTTTDGNAAKFQTFSGAYRLEAADVAASSYVVSFTLNNKEAAGPGTAGRLFLDNLNITTYSVGVVTPPTPISTFTITNVTRAADGAVSLTWPSEAAATYTVFYGSDLDKPLTDASWTVANDGVASGGATTSFTVPANAGVPALSTRGRVFFRVRKN